MTEDVTGKADQQAPQMPAVSHSAGQLLRQAREQQQMSLPALASALKVPVHKLEALEEDRWEVLGDSVFTRALALSVCRLLRIPAEPVLAGLPRHEGAKMAVNPEGINTPFKEKSLPSLMSSAHGSGAGMAMKLAIAVLIVLAVAAGLYFLPQWQQTTSQASPVTQTVVVQSPHEPVFMPALQTEASAAAVGQLESQEEQAVQATEAAALVSAPLAPVIEVVAEQPSIQAEQPQAQESATTAAPALAPALAAPIAASDNATVVRFAATGESWVQVRDAQRQVLMEKVLKAGDVYEQTIASRPLQVVVGNAGVTTLEVDGAPFDLAAVAKNNVARFEVK